MRGNESIMDYKVTHCVTYLLQLLSSTWIKHALNDQSQTFKQPAARIPSHRGLRYTSCHTTKRHVRVFQCIHVLQWRQQIRHSCNNIYQKLVYVAALYCGPLPVESNEWHAAEPSLPGPLACRTGPTDGIALLWGLCGMCHCLWPILWWPFHWSWLRQTDRHGCFTCTDTDSRLVNIKVSNNDHFWNKLLTN